MLHRIRHQILELELPREAGAVALQRRASRVFQEQVLPRLDEAFNRIAPNDRVVRIDRLDLDLGNIAEANWERDFVDKCVAQISQQVAEAAFTVGGEQAVVTLSAAENAVAIFKYFLETGMLPWHAKHLTLKVLEDMIDNAMTNGTSFSAQELRRILKENPGSLQRLVWQFSTAFSEKIVEAVLGLSEGLVQQAIQIRQSQTAQKMSKAEFLMCVKNLLKADTSVLKNTPLTPVLLAQIFFLENQSEARPLYGIDAPKEQAHLRTSVEETQVQKKALQRKTDPEGISVDDAGLVLLAVYLPPFFKKLGIELSGNSIPNHQFRAVHLLHFLATGQEYPEEPQLVLPKILCGLALDTPIPQDLSLDDEEKFEANRLLEAIVRNWPVLKNTSPDGLRSGFLRRAGLLTWSDNRESWVLRVERLGQDLLLEKMPWSYSVVRLPWMGEMVSVEW